MCMLVATGCGAGMLAHLLVAKEVAHRLEMKGIREEMKALRASSDEILALLKSTDRTQRHVEP